MKKLTVEDPETKSPDFVANNVEELKRLLPEAFTDGKIDFEVLKQLLGGAVEEGEEKYGLNWHGKRAARQLALTPSLGTLHPAPEESVAWDTTKNLMIEGDNLEVLKLLQKSYAGRVKLIYIDPPYNTGNDFVYADDYRDSLRNYLEVTGQVSQGGRKIGSNAEVSGRYHTRWLDMMYPRLKLARNLLRDDGVIFVSIDEREVHNLQAMMHEVFGEENFHTIITWQKRYTRSNNTVGFTSVTEYVLVFSKSEDFGVNLLERTAEADARYSNPDNDVRGPWKGASFLNPATPQQRPNLCYPIRNPNTGEISRPTSHAWRRSAQEFERLQSEGRLYWGSDGKQPVPSIKMFLSEARELTPINFWDHAYAGNTDDGTKQVAELFGAKVFDNPKPVQLLLRILEHGADSESIVLDFFAGSGGTGHAVMLRNATAGTRMRFILVQLPEPIERTLPGQAVAAEYCDAHALPLTLSEITKERLRKSGKKVAADNPITVGDIGFRVFKLASSGLKPWAPQPLDIEQAVLDSVSHVRHGVSEDDLLWELLVRRGVDLSVPVERIRLGGHEANVVGNGVVVACLSTTISHDHIEALAREISDLVRERVPAGETLVVFRDDAFGDDVVKANLAAILAQHGIESVRSI